MLCAPATPWEIGMQRYFFHVMDGRAVVDAIGIELPDLWAVRLHAIKLASTVLADLETGLLLGQPWQMTVADENSNTVFSLTFSANTHGT